jgi:hypothetical protein
MWIGMQLPISAATRSGIGTGTVLLDDEGTVGLFSSDGEWLIEAPIAGLVTGGWGRLPL